MPHKYPNHFEISPNNQLVKDFDHVRSMTRNIVEGNSIVVAIYSQPGLGKTYTIEEVLKKLGIRIFKSIYDPFFDLTPPNRRALKVSVGADVNAFLDILFVMREGGYLIMDDADSIVISGSLQKQNLMKDITLPRNVRTVNFPIKIDSVATEVGRQPVFEITTRILWLTNVDFDNPINIKERSSRQSIEAIFNRINDRYGLTDNLNDIVEYTLWLAVEHNMLRNHPHGTNPDLTKKNAMCVGGFKLEQVNDILRFYCDNVRRLRDLSPRGLFAIGHDRRSYPDTWENVQRQKFLPSPRVGVMFPPDTPVILSPRQQKERAANSGQNLPPRYRSDAPKSPPDPEPTPGPITPKPPKGGQPIPPAVVDQLADAIAGASAAKPSFDLMGRAAKGTSQFFDEPTYAPPVKGTLDAHLREVAKLVYRSDFEFVKVHKDAEKPSRGVLCSAVDSDRYFFMNAWLPAYPELENETLPYVMEKFEKDGAYVTRHVTDRHGRRVDAPKTGTVSKNIPWKMSLDTVIYPNLILNMDVKQEIVHFATGFSDGHPTLKLSPDPDCLLSELPMEWEGAPGDLNLSFNAKVLQWVFKKQKFYEIKKLLLNKKNMMRIDIEGVWGMYLFYVRAH